MRYQKWAMVTGTAVVLTTGCTSVGEVASNDGTPSSQVVEQEDQESAPDEEGTATEPSPSPEEPSPTAAEQVNLEVVESGFQAYEDFDGASSASWAVVMENPNAETWIAVGTDVTVSFLDAEGTVISSESDSVAAILPGQRAALAGTSYDLGEEPAEMRVQARARDWEEADSPGPYGEFIMSGVNVRAVDFGGYDVTGTVESSFEQDFEDVYAVAVLRDAEGAIVGGGWTFIDFVPAGDTTSVEVNVSDDLSSVESAELYMTLSNLSLMAAEG